MDTSHKENEAAARSNTNRTVTASSNKSKKPKASAAPVRPPDSPVVALPRNGIDLTNEAREMVFDDLWKRANHTCVLPKGAMVKTCRKYTISDRTAKSIWERGVMSLQMTGKPDVRSLKDFVPGSRGSQHPANVTRRQQRAKARKKRPMKYWMLPGEM